jgi:hypothetical protein
VRDDDGARVRAVGVLDGVCWTTTGPIPTPTLVSWLFGANFKGN